MVAVYASLCVLLIDWTIAAILGVRVMAGWCSDRLQYTRLIAGLLIDPSHMLFVVQAAVSWCSTALVAQNRKKKRKRKQQQPQQQRLALIMMLQLRMMMQCMTVLQLQLELQQRTQLLLQTTCSVPSQKRQTL
jgi:hypothetical protein